MFPLSTGSITTSLLAVYQIPCNVSFSTMVTGIGHCPEHLSVSIPFYTATSIQFVTWQSAAFNVTTVSFSHPVFDIPSPVKLNTTVLAELDSTMATLDGKLTSTILSANDQIDTISTSTTMEATDYIAGVALGLSLVSCMGLTVLIFCYRNHGLTGTDIRIIHRFRHCQRRVAVIPRGGEADVDCPPAGDTNQRVHDLDITQAERNQ